MPLGDPAVAGTQGQGLTYQPDSGAEVRTLPSVSSTEKPGSWELPTVERA